MLESPDLGGAHRGSVRSRSATASSGANSMIAPVFVCTRTVGSIASSGPWHRSAAGPTPRAGGSEQSPGFRARATTPSVTERIRPLARRPRQTGHAPAVRFDRPLGRAGVPADQAVQVQEAVQVPGLVLEHPGE